MQSHSTGIRNLSLESYKKIRVPVPPLPEQRRIVAILDEAFEGLAVAAANAEKNLKNARELFDSALDTVFKHPNVNWRQAHLGEVCDFIGGSQPPKSSFSTLPARDRIRLIQIRDYKSDKHIVFIPKDQARRFCDETDVMIGRYGPPLFQILRGISGAYNVALMKAVPDEKVISKDFLFFFLKNRSILHYIVSASSRAAGQIGLNKATLEPYPICFPDLLQQAAIVDRLELLERRVELLEQQYEQGMELVAELKQSLLHKAFSGELTSRAVEATLEAAQ